MTNLPVAAAALAILDELPRWQQAADVMAISTRLRHQGHEPTAISQALTQWRLRAKATHKFGEFADHMLFTEDGLQQATRLQVTATHVTRMRGAGIDTVYDLGCGVGADALAFAAAGLNVRAVEIDPHTADVAAYNLTAFQNAQVECADAAVIADSISPSAHTALWWDPARRVVANGSRKRTFSPDDFSPSLAKVFDCARSHPTGIKLGPGHPHDGIPAQFEAQWVAVGTEAVELALYNAPLTDHLGQWSALVLPAHEGAPDCLVTDRTAPQPIVRELQEYIIEPNPAVIRSQGIATFAAKYDLGLVSDNIAYLTGVGLQRTQLATYYEVLGVVPLKLKAINAYLRSAEVGRVTIKKRGADIDPAALHKDLKLSGPNEVTLFLTRINGRHRAIITAPAIR